MTLIATSKSYTELITIPTFKERFRYLQLNGMVAYSTFGQDRYLNQILYRSDEWKKCRCFIIIRDGGLDLGCDGYEIYGDILVHHINPISVDDILTRNPMIFDPDNLICVSHNTHNAIHYGDSDLLIGEPIQRRPNDTCPWR